MGADVVVDVHRLDAELVEHRLRTHAGALQDLRRGDGPGAEQHLAAGTHPLDLAAAPVAHAHRPPALELDDVGGGPGLDGQVLPPLRLVQIAASGGGAPPVRGDEAVHGSEALDRKSTRLNSSHVRSSYAVF